MSQNLFKSRIGDAWRQHRSGDNQSASSAFLSLLQELQGHQEHVIEHIDTLYGLALSERALGKTADAHSHLQAAAEVVAEAAAAHVSDENDLGTTLDDRFLMLKRMIQQRLSELT